MPDETGSVVMPPPAPESSRKEQSPQLKKDYLSDARIASVALQDVRTLVLEPLTSHIRHSSCV